MTTPYCGSTCIVSEGQKFLPACQYSYGCLCKNQNYIDGWYTCISSCSASDIQTWIQDAIVFCRPYGVTWPSSAASPATPVSTVVAASTVVVPSTVVVASATTVTRSTTVPNPFGITTTAPTPGGASSNALPSSSSGPESLPLSQSTSDGGLSTGAKAGIAIGVVGMVLLALIATYLLWRRKNQKSGAFREERARTDEPELARGQQSNFYKEVKPTTATVATVTSIKPPQQLPDGPTMVDSRYISPVPIPELQHHPRLAPTSTPQPFSPAPAYSEFAAPVPSELDPATQQTNSWHAPPPGGVTEVDSRAISPQSTSHQPASELAHSSSFAVHHELPAASPEASSSITGGPDQTMLSAQNDRMPATMVSPGASFAAAGPGEEDAELKHMKAEIEAVRARKERLQEMQAVEDRERELSRMIVERELEASRR